MDITLQRYTPEFYDTCCEWWSAHKWPAIPENMLPQFGLIAYAGDVPVAVNWLYQTDSNYCIMEWTVCNPEFREKPAREKALNGLIFGMKEAAQLLGFKQIYTSVKQGRFCDRLESLGFMRTDINMVNMIAEI